MTKLKQFSKRLMKNNKGQGMVEYILLLVVVVAIVVALKEPLSNYVQGDMFENLKGQIGRVMGN
ncbi:MAG TPA: Flp1 family type IVb pilin [Pseudobdellovibrionaceae bacterium]|nr:Flp1 family type IVb pilin [Pseudobdellovibrionaceae bacterium]